MKAFKLIVIFIVLLGGVVGAFFLLTDVEIDVLPSPSNTIYQSYSDEIKDDWKKKETGTKSSSYGIANPSTSLAPSLKQAL